MTDRDLISKIKAIDLGAEYSDKELIEMMLDGIIPGYSAGEAANELTSRYGTLFDICEMPFNVLRQVMGVGEEGAKRLKLARAFVYNILRENSSENRRRLFELQEIVKYLRPYFVGKTSEILMVVFVNAKYKHIHTQKLGEGSFDHVSFDARKILELAIKYKANGIILAHNHSGSVLPSADDTVITNKFNKFVLELDMELIDHIIFCENNYKSMRKSGYLKDPKQKAVLDYFPKQNEDG